MGKAVIANGQDAIDAHARAVKEGLEHYHGERCERERLTTLCTKLEQEISLLRQRCEDQDHHITRLIAERDHYLAAHVEAHTQLTSAANFLAESVKHARNAPFRRLERAAQRAETRDAMDDKALAALEEEISGARKIAAKFAPEPYEDEIAETQG
jgi:chromosome segregation ATPase